MAKKHPRSIYLRTNKYQRQIICLVLFPSALTIIAVSSLLIVFYRHLINVLLNGNVAQSVMFLNEWAWLILVLLLTILILIFLYSFTASLHLVGAFGRIIRELDETIDGKRKGDITARPEDKLARELLKRINHLIQKAGLGE